MLHSILIGSSHVITTKEISGMVISRHHFFLVISPRLVRRLGKKKAHLEGYWGQVACDRVPREGGLPFLASKHFNSFSKEAHEKFSPRVTVLAEAPSSHVKRPKDKSRKVLKYLRTLIFIS